MSPDEYEDPSVLYEAITSHEKVRNFLVLILGNLYHTPLLLLKWEKVKGIHPPPSPQGRGKLNFKYFKVRRIHWGVMETPQHGNA